MTAINPYSSLPADRYWRRAVASIPPFALDPSRPADFTISQADRVASAGSCFAQEVARVLRRAGCNFLTTEDPPPGGDDSHANFSAQYGNVYTTRQLVQLFARAFGAFSPALEAWQGPNGRWVDPFRPRMVPGGFDTARDVVAARDRHLAAVARMFRDLDVFIFTFGLTEGWRHARDGAALPLAPGVAGGEWDPGEFAFVNARVSDMVDDMLRFLDQLAAVNPGARVVLTVSPVPIVATLETRHVLTSSTYTKSALRVVADEVCAARPNVSYFPSYEIVTCPTNAGRYFEPNMRAINTAGLDHVMRVFARHLEGGPGRDKAALARGEDLWREGIRASQVICDEEMLDA